VTYQEFRWKKNQSEADQTKEQRAQLNTHVFLSLCKYGTLLKVLKIGIEDVRLGLFWVHSELNLQNFDQTCILDLIQESQRAGRWLVFLFLSSNNPSQQHFWF